MKITLIQDEIHQAVEAYVRSQINIASNQEVTIDFTSGRGPDGLTATLDIRPAAITAPAAVLKRDFASQTRSPTVAVSSVSAAAPVAAEAEPEPTVAAEPEEEEAPAPAPEAVTEEAAPAPAPVKKSPFAKMKAEEPAEDAAAAPAEASAEARPKSIFSRAAAE